MNASSMRPAVRPVAAASVPLLTLLTLLAACASPETPSPPSPAPDLADEIEPLRFALGRWSSLETSYAPGGAVLEIEAGGLVELTPVAGGRFIVMSGHFPADPEEAGLLWFFQPGPGEAGILARGTASDDTDIIALTGDARPDGSVTFDGRLGPEAEGPGVRVTLAPAEYGVRVSMAIEMGDRWVTARVEEWTPAE